MAEYIEREALKEHLGSYAGMFTAELGFVVNLQAVLDGIDFQPAADVVPVVHGRWERIGEDYENCSNCGTVFEAKPTQYFFEMNNKFCRMCGARMDGE